MKNKLSLFLIAALLLAVSPAAFAQTATYQTVLSAAVNTTQTTITVASMTNMVASSQTVTSLIYCDGELMKINAINTTSLVASVSRGYDITVAGSHPTAMPCWFGVGGTGGGGTGGPFITQDPAGFGGGGTPVLGTACVRTAYPFLPLVNIRNNSLVDCVGTAGTAGGVRWRANSLAMFTGAHPLTNVNDAAYTATLDDEIVRMSNMTTARTVTLPAITGIVGKLMVFKHDGYTGLLTVAAPVGQFVSTVGTTTVTASQGATIKLMSVQAQSGAWGWMTIF